MGHRMNYRSNKYKPIPSDMVELVDYLWVEHSIKISGEYYGWAIWKGEKDLDGEYTNNKYWYSYGYIKWTNHKREAVKFTSFQEALAVATSIALDYDNNS